jgi:hypothetical protein
VSEYQTNKSHKTTRRHEIVRKTERINRCRAGREGPLEGREDIRKYCKCPLGLKFLYSLVGEPEKTLREIGGGNRGGRDPLIYSQWVSRRKVLACEGLAKEPGVKNLLWNLFWIGGCPQNIEEVRSPSVLSLFDSNRAARLGSQLNAPIKI